jgi:cyclohexyl-isocyanide hydratase
MTIGFLLFPGLTALDLVGPHEVLARLPGVQALRLGPAPGAVTAQHGLRLGVDLSWSAAPPLDVLCVPGGPGVGEALQDAALLTFLRGPASTSAWLTSVCTGSLLLGAAGLLQGYRATTHWRYHDLLLEAGAHPVRKRVVMDRNRVTAAGVTAGIDLGLFLAALLAGERTARAIELQLEYDPAPPFPGGSPELADDELLEAALADTAQLHAQRRDQLRAALTGRAFTGSSPGYQP